MSSVFLIHRGLLGAQKETPGASSTVESSIAVSCDAMAALEVRSRSDYRGETPSSGLRKVTKMVASRTTPTALLLLVLLNPLLQASPSLEVQRSSLPHPVEEALTVELLSLAPAGQGPWPAVLFVHGHQWPERPGAEVYLERGVLEAMARLGYLAAAVSQPGYGASDGAPDFCGPRSQQAVRAALEALREDPRVDPNRIVLYGASRGAIIASMVATKEPALAGLVLRGGIYDLEDAYQRMADDFGGKHNLEKEAGTSPGTFLERSALRVEEEILVPTLFFHGEADPISPVHQARKLAQRIHRTGTPVDLMIFRGIGHRIPWESRRERLESFLEEVFTLSE
ncbi:MAG: alpha/beta fold hydrolase [Deltaproteobacteria bacterium]|nr:alpha/beta fold hydrolase [Deltaproteobacteria bacterium]